MKSNYVLFRYKILSPLNAPKRQTLVISLYNIIDYQQFISSVENLDNNTFQIYLQEDFKITIFIGGDIFLWTEHYDMKV